MDENKTLIIKKHSNNYRYDVFEDGDEYFTPLKPLLPLPNNNKEQ